jgi:hypothetical protein
VRVDVRLAAAALSRWTCQRVQGGEKCRHKNAGRKRKCGKCEKPRPARRKAAHLKALDLDYEGFIELNGGETCAICGREASERRRLDRDHCHRTGEPRGLLCSRCNRALPSWMTADWLRDAAEYLERKS